MKSRHAVSSLVRRFNERGLDALELEHAGGPVIVYDDEKKQRILREFERQPDRDKDGTSHWSIKTLQKALRKADDGLPEVGIETVEVEALTAEVEKLRATLCDQTIELTLLKKSVSSDYKDR